MKRIFLFLSLCVSLAGYAQTDTLRADSIFQSLPEAMVRGERPIVKPDGVALLYNLPELIRNKPVDNAYDALKHIPGVVEIGESLQFAGQSVNVIIDGKAQILSSVQLTALLKNIPASRLKEAAFYASAPAKFQVRGILIDLHLKHESADRYLQAELFADAEMRDDPRFHQRANLNWTHGRLSADLLYSHGRERYYSENQTHALHTLNNGTTTQIDNANEWHGRHSENLLRLGADYNWTDHHRLSLVYDGQYNFSKGHETSTGWNLSHGNGTGRTRLHNVRMDYEMPWGLKAGAEMLFYRTPHVSHIHSENGAGVLEYGSESCQRINKWKTYLSGEHKLRSGWSLNYGGIYATTVDNSRQSYDNPDLQDTATRRREQRFDLYAGFSRSWTDRFSLSASLDVEHFKSIVQDTWGLFPTISATYMPVKKHILQLSLSSNKQYPPYWEMQDVASWQDSYTVLVGNPGLKPARDYGLMLQYVLKNKYVFLIGATHTSDYYVQLLYQSPERLMQIYKTTNFNYKREVVAQVVCPVKAGQWYDARFTVVGFWTNERADDFFEMPFNRHALSLMAFTTHTFSITKQLFFTLSAFARTRGIQGLYNLPASGNLDVGLRYSLCGGKVTFNLYGKNLLKTSSISPEIHYKTQYLDLHFRDFRTFGLSLSYRFGNFKEHKREAVDTSRLH
ncbi:MAG: TonB-dependent receptor [Alloprevotella sp.]|nr:TonB-dependent receptor [Alloprevotella sp.]